MTIPKKQPPRVTFRLPEALHQELIASAERNCVTLNAEVITRLQASSVLDRLDKQDQEIAELKAMLRDMLGRM